MPVCRFDGSPFERHSCGEGAKGQRSYDWAFVELTGNLLVWRSIDSPDDLTFFLTHASTSTPIPTLVVGAGPARG
jgi:hypothetical protein